MSQDTEQITRLLVQKPVAYAELDEMARIAISVLRDSGWTIERVGIDLTVDMQITRTPISEPESVAAARNGLKAAEDRYTQLRAAVVEDRMKLHINAWRLAAGAAAMATVATFFGRGWGFVMAAATFGIAVCVQLDHKRKGGQR